MAENKLSDSNLTLRSNLYVRTKKAYFGKGMTEFFLELEDRLFVTKIRGKKALLQVQHLKDMMTDYQKAQLRGGFCALGNETTNGPLRIGNKEVFVCRCDRRSVCYHRAKTGKTCDGCKLNDECLKKEVSDYNYKAKVGIPGTTKQIQDDRIQQGDSQQLVNQRPRYIRALVEATPETTETATVVISKKTGHFQDEPQRQVIQRPRDIELIIQAGPEIIETAIVEKQETTQQTQGDKMQLDDSQQLVIQCPRDIRLIVQAGPGTGKTAVACARTAWLIDREGIDPGLIWLISFTRTAVYEIRDRIAKYLDDGERIHAIKIATIDSHAWAIHSGFDSSASLLGDYEDNIQRLLELVKTHEGVREYLRTLEFLIVDEAQDIVGIRADLIVEIIRTLPKTCGVMIFSDDAQAIYGFTSDEDAHELSESKVTLTERLRAEKALAFEELPIETIFRTKSANLKKIFSETRKKVLQITKDPAKKLKDIKKEISVLADDQIDARSILGLSNLDDSFVLYRRRADVLLHSSLMELNPHRIRMSGLPVCIFPWVGACLSGYVESSLKRTTFTDLWRQYVHNTSFEILDEKDAWAHMVRIAGESNTIVDMRRLRQRLGRGAPPAEFCAPMLGHGGPILGTIHASKGREKEFVYLMMPPEPGDGADHEEETRVVFVGATRARERLIVGKGFKQYSRRLAKSGRTFSPKTQDDKPKAQVEIGRDGDITALGLVGREYVRTENEAIDRQRRLRDLKGNIVAARASVDHDLQHTYRILLDDGTGTVAVLSQRVNEDLFEIGRVIKNMISGPKRRPPDELPYLKIFGARTVVLQPDSPDLDKLHSPWSQSGIMLAPIVLGYPTCYFINY